MVKRISICFLIFIFVSSLAFAALPAIPIAIAKTAKLMTHSAYVYGVASALRDTVQNRSNPSPRTQAVRVDVRPNNGALRASRTVAFTLGVGALLYAADKLMTDLFNAEWREEVPSDGGVYMDGNRRVVYTIEAFLDPNTQTPFYMHPDHVFYGNDNLLPEPYVSYYISDQIHFDQNVNTGLSLEEFDISNYPYVPGIRYNPASNMMEYYTGDYYSFMNSVRLVRHRRSLASRSQTEIAYFESIPAPAGYYDFNDNKVSTDIEQNQLLNWLSDPSNMELLVPEVYFDPAVPADSVVNLVGLTPDGHLATSVGSIDPAGDPILQELTDLLLDIHQNPSEYPDPGVDPDLIPDGYQDIGPLPSFDVPLLAPGDYLGGTDIPGHPGLGVPFFDPDFDQPEKEEIPFSHWMSMIPFVHLVTDDNLTTGAGTCLIQFDTGTHIGQIISIDFCRFESHLNWIGGFLLSFAYFSAFLIIFRRT